MTQTASYSCACLSGVLEIEEWREALKSATPEVAALMMADFRAKVKMYEDIL